MAIYKNRELCEIARSDNNLLTCYLVFYRHYALEYAVFYNAETPIVFSTMPEALACFEKLLKEKGLT